MKAHRKKKLSIILFIAVGLSIAIGLSLFALSNNIDLFYTPTQVAAGEVTPGQRIRVGGMVKEGTVEHNQDELEVSFITTDYSHDVQVLYTGILPDLFREGQGIVAEGMLTSAGVFQASRVLAKHDENYMSAEVRSALESAGVDSDGMSSGAY
ncbi:cytochrome c-type biogenesis protein CcmE [Pseudohongiella nitratireducens]|jgi:cytochrome c-type biogenesis protein CcmE|uniref:Cytochrome c-type biogenesis protein CcmE n=1 Tax=Pseudohongiella nitratireducens TaxID=1768907 RepID=A0A917GK19_9GAMM|nr:cytochrome c maturation protein CcmE [Pseudohongiella nitratireducens]MDF1623624.1 cytochrome c maturation protein CcmE [Pseudohongiella nitratireducens]GGG48654.1 cytochrome c-type biogenesis protein CcmE [Pseudohongiella nitratireducens]